MNEAARRIMPQIDWEAKRLTKAEYVEFLETIVDGCETRLVAAREELQQESQS